MGIGERARGKGEQRAPRAEMVVGCRRSRIREAAA